MNPEMKQRLAALAGLAWIAAVFGAYHLVNTGYYRIKISTFARFFLGPS